MIEIDETEVELSTKDPYGDHLKIIFDVMIKNKHEKIILNKKYEIYYDKEKNKGGNFRTIGDLTGDGIPEFQYTVFDESKYAGNEKVYLVNGSSGKNLFNSSTKWSDGKYNHSNSCDVMAWNIKSN